MFLRRNQRFDPGSVSAGRQIYTVEGEKLGTVSEISGSYLHVDAPWKRDYWLSAEYIDRANGGVYMNFPKTRLDEYKLSEPGLEPEDDPMREISRDTVLITEEEQFEQRARMELELAQQREQLPPEHNAGTVGVPVEQELRVIEEEIGLPLGEMQNGAASPTGAIVSAAEVIAESPERVTTRNAFATAAVSDDDRAFAERWSLDEEEPNRGASPLLMAVVAVSVLAALCLFVWRLRR